MHQALLHLSISGRTVDSPYYSEEFVPFLMPFDALWHVKHNNLHKTHSLSKLPCYKQLQDQQSHWSDAIKHTCPLSMAIYGQTAHPIQLHVLEPERASAVGLPLESSPLGSIPRPGVLRTNRPSVMASKTETRHLRRRTNTVTQVEHVSPTHAHTKQK